jgi:hypothetical protein
LAKFSIFLITVALIAGMVGCAEPTDYALTITISGRGSVTATVNETKTVISPVEEETTISDLPKDTVIHLVAVAEAEEGFRFLKWTGDVDTIADVNAANTTITMNHSYSILEYDITAEFVEGLEIQDWYGLNATRALNKLGISHILMNALNSTTPGWEALASPTANGGKGWQPIVSFNSIFDGQGYEIRDLSINRTDESGVGLFGDVDKGGVVRNVTVVNATVTGMRNVGGLVGWNEGTVSSSNFTGSVNGSNEYVGGLVGRNDGGTVENSYSTGSVSGGSSVGGLVGGNEGKVDDFYSISNLIGSDMHVGGLVGWNDRTVSSSNSTGSVNGNWHVGGLVGRNDGGTVENSHSTGNVDGNMYVGGLVGYNYKGTVTNSYSSSSVTGRDEHVGGLVGWNQGTDENKGTVEESYSTGNVKGNHKVGGLVGFNNHGKVSKSHSTGNVTSEEGYDIGGLVGWNEGTVEESSYSIGNVKGNDNVGGLVGSNRGTVSSSNSTGSVNGTKYVGGLVGHNEGTVERSYSTGSVTGDDGIGGLVGENKHMVEESCSIGSVTGSSRSTRVGGLVGYNDQSSVENSYSTGNVAGYMFVGGLVGYNEQSSVENSYSTGSVIGFSQVGVGGLVGRYNGDDVQADVRNCFWDKETSGIEVSVGGTGKNTTEMKNIDTYTKTETKGLEEQWNIFEVANPSKLNPYRIWNIVYGETYPFLSKLGVVTP